MLNLQFRLGLQQMYGRGRRESPGRLPRLLAELSAGAAACPTGCSSPTACRRAWTQRASTRRIFKGSSTYTSSASEPRSSNSSGAATIAEENARGVRRVGRGQRADQRPRAVSRRLSDAQLEADHPRLLRREGVLCDRAHGVRADPRRHRQADSAAGVRRTMHAGGDTPSAGVIRVSRRLRLDGLGSRP